MWTIVENVERKGEAVVFETEDESVALEKLYELVKEDKKKYRIFEDDGIWECEYGKHEINESVVAWRFLK